MGTTFTEEEQVDLARGNCGGSIAQRAGMPSGDTAKRKRVHGATLSSETFGIADEVKYMSLRSTGL
jgi:hypothetical protein